MHGEFYEHVNTREDRRIGAGRIIFLLQVSEEFP